MSTAAPPSFVMVYPPGSVPHHHIGRIAAPVLPLPTPAPPRMMAVPPRHMVAGPRVPPPMAPPPLKPPSAHSPPATPPRCKPTTPRKSKKKSPKPKSSPRPLAQPKFLLRMKAAAGDFDPSSPRTGAFERKDEIRHRLRCILRLTTAQQKVRLLEDHCGLPHRPFHCRTRSDLQQLDDFLQIHFPTYLRENAQIPATVVDEKLAELDATNPPKPRSREPSSKSNTYQPDSPTAGVILNTPRKRTNRGKRSRGGSSATGGRPASAPTRTTSIPPPAILRATPPSSSRPGAGTRVTPTARRVPPPSQPRRGRAGSGLDALATVSAADMDDAALLRSLSAGHPHSDSDYLSDGSGDHPPTPLNQPSQKPSTRPTPTAARRFTVAVPSSHMAMVSPPRSATILRRKPETITSFGAPRPWDAATPPTPLALLRRMPATPPSSFPYEPVSTMEPPTSKRKITSSTASGASTVLTEDVVTGDAPAHAPTPTPPNTPTPTPTPSSIDSTAAEALLLLTELSAASAPLPVPTSTMPDMTGPRVGDGSVSLAAAFAASPPQQA